MRGERDQLHRRPRVHAARARLPGRQDQRATAAVLTTFAHATGRTEAEIADVMAAHRVFDAQDARAFGLIDVVQEPLDGMTTVRRR